MLHREVYERTTQFEERVAGARLRTYEWQFLANLDGKSTVGEILRRLGIDEPTIAEFIFEQERNGAIAPRLLSFQEFLESPESEPAAASQPEPARRPSASAQLKRTAGEELRAIARLSIAAAIGEILSLISKRRAATPAPSAAAPVASSAAAPSEAPPEASWSSSAGAFDALEAPAAHAAPPAPAAEAASPAEPASGLRYDRDDLASFQVFDWTLSAPALGEPATEVEAAIPPPAEPATNGSVTHELDGFEYGLDEQDVDYLHAIADEPVVFEDGLTIADRLLRDYGPIDATEVPVPEPPVEIVPHVEDAAPAAEADSYAGHDPYRPFDTPEAVAEPPQEPSPFGESERDPHRVTFSVNDLAGYIERIEPPPAAPEVTGYVPPAFEPAAHELPMPQPFEAEPEREEAIEAALTDPIVFSLSARNPDSFWSGKK